MSDRKGQHTNEKEAQKVEDKKDEGKLPKAHAGASGPGTDNTSAGSGGRGGHRRREGGPPEGKYKSLGTKRAGTMSRPFSCHL